MNFDVIKHFVIEWSGVRLIGFFDDFVALLSKKFSIVRELFPRL